MAASTNRPWEEKHLPTRQLLSSKSHRPPIPCRSLRNSNVKLMRPVPSTRMSSVESDRPGAESILFLATVQHTHGLRVEEDPGIAPQLVNLELAVPGLFIFVR